MRKWISSIIITLLVAGGAIICAIRWQAWFGMPAEPLWTGDTIDYVFPTLPKETDTLFNSLPNELTILVLGDIHNKLQRSDYDTLAARVPEVAIVAQTGDWIDRGQNYYYQLLVREWTNSALDSLPVITCPGNHEYSKGLRKTISPIWSHAFLHPNNGPIDVPGSSYVVDLPQIRFIAIDTNPLVRLVYLTRTLTWLRQNMKEAGDKYVVVLMHHPVLSAGKGRFNPLLYAAFRIALGDADLVISGHDHSYMRYKSFVVLNTAGNPKPQHTVCKPDVTDTVPVYGIIQIPSSTSDLKFTVHRLQDGTVIDSLYVKHN